MRKAIPAIVEHEIRVANDGRLPVNQEMFERAAARFGYEVHYHAPPFRPEHSGIAGETINVPEIVPNYALHPCYLHELAEACMRWEGRAPIVDLPLDQKHEVARRVERAEPRRRLSADLSGKIARLAGMLGRRMQGTGYDYAEIFVEDGKTRISLKCRNKSR